MLEQLVVENWKCHLHEVVEFAEGITTFAGTSDVGKSALMGAMRWVCTNQPTGDRFISWGAKVCTVTLYVDGHVIERKRGRGQGVNTYTVDGVPLQGFGVGVPKEVTDILNLDPGGLNWQRQIESHLWFHERSTVLIGEINRLVDMTAIDTAVSRLSSQHRSAKVTAGVYLDELHKARDTYNAVSGHAARVQALKGVIAQGTACQAATAQRRQLAGMITKAEKAEATGAQVRAVGRLCQAAQQTGALWRDAVNRAQALRTLYNKAAGATLVLHHNPLPDATPLQEAHAAWLDARLDTQHIREALTKARTASTTIANTTAATKTQEALKAKFKDCPSCGRPLRS